jgi:hypothetical protein
MTKRLKTTYYHTQPSALTWERISSYFDELAFLTLFFFFPFFALCPSHLSPSSLRGPVVKHHGVRGAQRLALARSLFSFAFFFLLEKYLFFSHFSISAIPSPLHV